MNHKNVRDALAEISELVWGKISRARAVVGDSGLKTFFNLQESGELWQEKKPPPTGAPPAAGAQWQG